MNVAELIKVLQKMPQELPVVSEGPQGAASVHPSAVIVFTGRWWDCETQAFKFDTHLKITGV